MLVYQRVFNGIFLRPFGTACRGELDNSDATPSQFTCCLSLCDDSRDQCVPQWDIYIYIHIIYIYYWSATYVKTGYYGISPLCGAYGGGLYPNLSRINFLGPSFFRNKFPFPKKGTTPRRTCTQKISRINFGTMGANISGSSSSGQGPVYPFESLQQTPLRETPHFSLVASVAEYFSMGQPPWTFKIPKLGLNKFPRRIFFSGTGSWKKSCQHEPGYGILMGFMEWEHSGSNDIGGIWD